MLQVDDLYPSRTGGVEKIIDRPDPVVFGSGESPGEHGLTPDQLRHFEDKGYVVLDGYLEDMVEPLLAETQRLAAELGERPEVVREPDSDVVRSIFAVQNFSDLFARFARDPRMLDIARQIVGSEVYLHQSRINVKPPLDGKSFSWHSDFETWHVEDGMPRPRAVTGWIMLTENTPENGPLFVVPGSHRRYVSCAGTTPDDNHTRSLRKQVLGSPSLAAVRELAKDEGVVGVYGRPGTVVFHECNILHGSPDNLSPWPRTNAFFVYNSVFNVPERAYGIAKRRPDYLGHRDTTPLEPAEPLN